MNRKMPLEQWTLGEVRDLCVEQGNTCDGCPFLDGKKCYISDTEPAPLCWEFDNLTNTARE